jgi:hypothetical protein
MRGERANLNDVKTATADRFQTIKYTIPGKTTGGQADRPIAHKFSVLKEIV